VKAIEECLSAIESEDVQIIGFFVETKICRYELKTTREE
jgi:hypothetical protein